jgi:hypothetical protein
MAGTSLAMTKRGRHEFFGRVSPARAAFLVMPEIHNTKLWISEAFRIELNHFLGAMNYFSR